MNYFKTSKSEVRPENFNKLESPYNSYLLNVLSKENKGKLI